MSETLKSPEPQGSATEETSPQVEKKPPNKRGRLSFIERAQKESEELVKNMGGTLELEGGRRTRSSARGTPSRSAVVTPPPVKKARNSPASPKSTPRARGRGRKLDTTETPEPPEQQPNEEKEEKVETITPIPAENDVTKEVSTDKPETNGPEKSTEDDDNDDVVPENSKNSEVEAQKVEKDKKLVKESKEVDQVDAELKPVQEEKGSLSKVGEPVIPIDSVQEKPVATIVAAVDSPMDVDERSSTQEADVVQLEDSKSDSVENTEAETKPTIVTVESEPETEPSVETEPVAIEKQPTPEPMEVDSSSKSSDVIECTDVVDKVESIVSAVQTESISSVEQPTDKPVSNVLVNDSLPVAEKTAEILTKLKANSEENGTTKEIDLSAVTGNDISVVPAVAEVKSTDARAATEESKIDSVIESKTENNIDEPKVTPPQLSATGDAVVTTI